MHSGPEKAGEEVAYPLHVGDREDGAVAEFAVRQVVDERRQEVRDLLTRPPAAHAERLTVTARPRLSLGTVTVQHLRNDVTHRRADSHYPTDPFPIISRRILWEQPTIDHDSPDAEQEAEHGVTSRGLRQVSLGDGELGLEPVSQQSQRREYRPLVAFRPHEEAQLVGRGRGPNRIGTVAARHDFFENVAVAEDGLRVDDCQGPVRVKNGERQLLVRLVGVKFQYVEQVFHAVVRGGTLPLVNKAASAFGPLDLSDLVRRKRPIPKYKFDHVLENLPAYDTTWCCAEG